MAHQHLPPPPVTFFQGPYLPRPMGMSTSGYSMPPPLPQGGGSELASTTTTTTTSSASSGQRDKPKKKGMHMLSVVHTLMYTDKDTEWAKVLLPVTARTGKVVRVLWDSTHGVWGRVCQESLLTYAHLLVGLYK